MTDKKQKATKVKCKQDESLAKQSVRRWTHHFTKIDQEKRKIEQICIWNPMNTLNIDLRHHYGISVAECARNFTSGEERGETDVFAG